jgi:hypothetical protein
MRLGIYFDFYGRPRPTAALHCYLIQAVTFGLTAYFFLSWDPSGLAFIPADAFHRVSRPLLFAYWKTPWFYYTTFQFIYDFVPRPSEAILNAIRLLIVASSILGLIGVWPRAMAWTSFLLASHLIGAFLLASDTMDASTTVLLFMLFLVGLFPKEAYYAVGEPFRPLDLGERYHGPVFLLLFFMTGYYFMSAVNKVVDVGWDWFLRARLDLFSKAAIEKSLFASTWWTSLWFSSLLANKRFALISAFLVFFLELIAPLCLFLPRLIPVLFVFFFASMHLSIYLSHGYGYWSNICADLLLLPYTTAAVWFLARSAAFSHVRHHRKQQV